MALFADKLLDLFPSHVQKERIPVYCDDHFNDIWGLTALDCRLMPKNFNQKWEELKKVKSHFYDCQYEFAGKKKRNFKVMEDFCPSVCPFPETVSYQNWFIYMKEETKCFSILGDSSNLTWSGPFCGNYEEDGVEEASEQPQPEVEVINPFFEC